MECNNPLYRLPVSPKSLQTLGYVVQGTAFAGRRPHRGAYFFTRKDLHKIPLNLRDNLQPIGCGSCIACRLSYAKNWADRLQLESRLYQNNYFLTLTYEDEHLPVCNSVDTSTGEYIPFTLSKKDVQCFVKRLREFFRRRGFEGFRFFASGEYGERNGRPHYHMILLNCPDFFSFDFVFLKKNGNGDSLFTSELLSSLWNKGFVTVGLCTPLSISYTAKYCLKKVSPSQRSIPGFQYPFCLMSRNPGIGKPYFDLHKSDIERTGKVILQTKDDFHISNAPHYFLYLSRNLPVRACRFRSDHFTSDVIAAERSAIQTVDAITERRAAANVTSSALSSFDLCLIPRRSEGQNLLQCADAKCEALTLKHKKYNLTFKTL